jgi:hypothetical protein
LVAHLLLPLLGKGTWEKGRRFKCNLNL